MPSANRADLVTEYCRDLANASNEAVKKERFILLLTKLFEGRDNYDIIRQFTAGAENSIANISRTGRPSERGRADTQYGSVIIEFEHSLARTGAHAVDQLKEYLSGNWNSSINARFTLIATDCLEWRVYSPDYQSLTRLGTIRAEDIVLEKIESFTAAPGQADGFYYFLDRYLFKTEVLPATLEGIRQSFGHGSDICQSVMLSLHSVWEEIKDQPEMRAAFTQWEKFLSIAYGRFSGTDQVFLTHSYLSVLAKMLAYEVITGDNFIDERELTGIITGEIFEGKNVANFTDEDFFRWTAQNIGNIRIRDAFRAIATGLGQFDFGDVREDILKGVYQELIDDDTRHALGEHYTPDWLCADVIDKLDPKEGQTVLDPSCGSGSFLKAVANHLVADNPDITAAKLNESLYGIDVHPLSVQITKATLLIAYGKRLLAEPKPVTLNVFLANTLLLPKNDVSLFGERFTVSIDGRGVPVDAGLFSDRRRLSLAVTMADEIAGRDKEKEPRKREDLDRIIRSGLPDATRGELDGAYALYEAFQRAKKEERNGIWAYIVSNSYAPLFLKEKFDFVAGNPPWLTFNNITSENYQNAVMSLAKRCGVLAEESSLNTHLELAAVFLGHCVDYFLKPHGTLAFVLPRSFFSADQHKNIRTSKVNYLRLIQLWDLAGVSPLFNVPSCVIFAERGNTSEKRLDQIPCKVVTGRLRTRNPEVGRARQSLNVSDETAWLCSLNDRTAWSTRKRICIRGEATYRGLFRQGATLVPRTLAYIDIEQEYSGALDDRVLRVKSCADVYREAKQPWKSFSISGRLNTRFFFQTALANNVVPFGLNGIYDVALPCCVDDFGGLSMMSAEQVEREGDLDSSKWFFKAEKIWNENKTERNRNTGLIGWLNYMNKLTCQNLHKKYVVLYSTSGSNAVSVYLKRDDHPKFVADYTTYVYATNSRREAAYLSAYLNSSVANDIIKPFQTTGLMGARHICAKILEIPLPRYFEGDARHVKLAALSEAASEKVSKFVAGKNFDAHGGNMTANQLGRFRNEVRAHVESEMKDIDSILENIFSLHNHNFHYF